MLTLRDVPSLVALDYKARGLISTEAKVFRYEGRLKMHYHSAFTFAFCLFTFYLLLMALPFSPGDDLVFQLESGFGLLRVLAVEEHGGGDTVWHVLVYEDFYPDVESAERALISDEKLGVRNGHLALTDHALEKTPAARLGNRPVTEDEMSAYREWVARGGEVFDRSVLLMLGLR